MSFKIYTRAGDDGSTSLLGGGRVPKHHLRVEGYGTVDELNSYLGVIRSFIQGSEEEKLLAQVQNNLFTLGSSLACEPGTNTFLPPFNPDDIQALELEIDRLTSPLPELKNFVLPGGSQAGAFAHVARTVCRRAERLVVHLSQVDQVEPFVVKYLNRLSDYLFTLARHLDNQQGSQEIIWNPRGN